MNIQPIKLDDMIAEAVDRKISKAFDRLFEESKDDFVNHARDELSHEFFHESDIDRKMADAIENVFNTMRFTVKPDQ
jgi:hypothetical protein|tara:strand:- start:681 stop:911 length:231 start_codon:yes stop_codon:yes gene_type:complete